MSLELLEIMINNSSGWGYRFAFSYHFDLESFFYVFLTGCVEYGRDPSLPALNLDYWCTEDMENNIENKANDINLNFKDFISNKFSSSFIDTKELAMELHEILFGEHKYLYRFSFPNYALYNAMIGAINKTIGNIEAGKVPNRTWTNETTAAI
ncbi:Bgt-50323 [Blumeria graminis f. sp. tritici]|uniref:Bgt-50323 n=1 Tax=Blumeria graminis f. sp. tritici TaxID=62690 RepID=A0A9X9MEL0_BLUGR|nr:Bgt-50323 [Blumeria graminis f. sp. tritici]